MLGQSTVKATALNIKHTVLSADLYSSQHKEVEHGWNVSKLFQEIRNETSMGIVKLKICYGVPI